MVFRIVVLAALAVSTYAIVCTPELCSGVKKTPLTCAGDVIENGGFCGCTDICAGVQGDSCIPEGSNGGGSMVLGMPNPPRCSTGYECVPDKSNSNMLFGAGGVCSKKEIKISSCQQQRRARLMSMVVWRGQWVPNCNQDGTYMAKQCDNAGSCFCVTPVEGKIIVGSKKVGDVTC